MPKEKGTPRRIDLPGKTRPDWAGPNLAAIRRGVQRFRRCLKRCREKQDIDSVHDLRVEARRLLVWCDLLVWFKASPPASAARRDVKRLLRALARLRDTQVQLHLLADMPASTQPGQRCCRRSLRREEQRQSERVRRRCRQIHLARISDGLIDGAELRWLRVDPQVLRRQGSGWVNQLVRQAEQALRQRKPHRPVTLHRLRISLKHLRYALEALGHSVSPSGRPSLTRLQTLQRLLGEIQDAEVFLTRLREIALDHPRHAPELSKLAPWLFRRREGRIRRLMSQSAGLRKLLQDLRKRWVVAADESP